MPYGDTSNTRFWNTSGIELSYGPDGPSLSIESLQTLATGGVAFDTPGIENPSDPAEEGSTYPLFDNQRSVEAARYTRKLPFLVHFDGSVRGLISLLDPDVQAPEADRLRRILVEQRADVVRAMAARERDT